MPDHPDTPAVHPAEVLVTALRDIHRRLLAGDAGPLDSRIRETREELARLFAVLRTDEALRGREYVLQMLVQADSELDRADDVRLDPVRAEAQLAWASHDLEQATAWLQGANSEVIG